MNVLAGDSVDFAVGYGTDQSYAYDTTRLQVVIETAAVPLPAGLPLLAGSLVILGGLRRRIRRTT